MAEHAQPFSPEELFEHAAFLRQLARGLLRDEHLAEDVAQEAMVAALEHPPRERGALRGWLAQAARNLALNRRTSATRRRQREERAARPERLDPGEEANERLELERTVFDHVLALDEAKRTALFLRYHEGLEPAAIAERLGVPLKTVKTRLARGLAELRERLEHRYGDRRALGLALAALAREPALGVTTTLIGGGLAMKCGLGAVLGLVLLFVWQGTRERHATERRELGRIGDRVLWTDTFGNGYSGTAAEAAAWRRPIPSAPVAAPLESWELTGTVRLREDGSPLAGVAVEVRLPIATGDRRLRATTDESGGYRFQWPGPGTLGSIEAGATPTTTPVERWLGQSLVAGQPRVVDLWATRGASLNATVVDPDGQPVAGASVRAWCTLYFDPSRPEDRHATSAADGSFVLEHLGKSFVLTAEKPGLACLHGLRGTLAAGTSARGLRVVMAEATWIRGHVVDWNERAVEGAELTLAPHQSSSDQDGTAVPGVARFRALELRTTSRGDGAFELGPVPGRWWSARIAHPGFLSVDRTLDPALPDNRIVLDPGFRLRGSVLGWDGKPLAGALVTVEPQEGEQKATTTDARGSFDVGALTASDNASVLVVADDHAVFARQPVQIGPDGGAFLELRLERPTPLAGRVLDAAGAPLSGALVRAEGDRLLDYEDVDFGERTTWEWSAGRNKTYSDAEGRFRFTQLYEGDFELRVSPPDEPELWTRVRTRSGREDLEITLDRGALERVVFSGRVLDGRTLAPVPEFTVSPMRASTGGGTRGANNRAFGPESGGEFRLAGNEPGAYELRASATGFAGWNEELREYREGETRFEVVLWPMCTPSFVVRDAEGRPLAHPAQLVFHDLDGRRLSVEHGSWSSDQASIGQGPEHVAGLPMRVVRVTASAPGYRDRGFELDLTVPPGDPVAIVLERDPGAKE